MRGLRASDYQCLLAPISLIGSIHIIGGLTVLVIPSAANVSALAGPMMVIHDEVFWGFLFIIVGVMAIAGRLLLLDRDRRIAVVIPQQLVLLLQLWGVIVAVAVGAYPDGYVPVPGDKLASAWFILGDQAALIILCLSHVVEMCCGNWIVRTRAEWERRLTDERNMREHAERALGYQQNTKFWLDTKWD